MRPPPHSLTDVVNLFVHRPAAWSLAITSAGAIGVATVYVYTVGARASQDMTAGQRRLDVFCRAFLGAAWSGYSNYASKAVVEVTFAAVSDHTAHDWTRPAVYLLAFIMIASLILQVSSVCVCVHGEDEGVVARAFLCGIRCVFCRVCV